MTKRSSTMQFGCFDEMGLTHMWLRKHPDQLLVLLIANCYERHLYFKKLEKRKKTAEHYEAMAIVKHTELLVYLSPHSWQPANPSDES